MPLLSLIYLPQDRQNLGSHPEKYFFIHLHGEQRHFLAQTHDIQYNIPLSKWQTGNLIQIINILEQFFQSTSAQKPYCHASVWNTGYDDKKQRAKQNYKIYFDGCEPW